MIKVSSLNLAFDGRKVLSDFSYEFEGGITALYGPSGIGKTTLAGIIMGLVVPDSGSVYADVCISAVFQEPRLLEWQTALSNAALPLPRSEKGLAEEWLNRLGVGYLCKKRVSSLSGGEKQRVALARAMAYYDLKKSQGENMLLILDEPLTGLDIASQKETARQIKRSLGGGDCLLISHDLGFCKSFADSVLLLDGPPVTVSDRM